MAIGWFVVPMLIKDSRIPPYFKMRYCAMDNHTATIYADDGNWRESEVLGNHALVRVRASAATLINLNSVSGFLRILSKVDLSETLGDLTAAQRTAVLNKLQALGYTLAEIQVALGGTLAGWRSRTFGDLLRFIAKRRKKPQSIDANGDVVFSDTDVIPLPVEELVKAVP